VHTEFWSGGPRERDHLDKLSVDGMIILKWIFRTWVWEAWTELVWLRIWTDRRQCRLEFLSACVPETFKLCKFFPSYQTLRLLNCVCGLCI